MTIRRERGNPTITSANHLKRTPLTRKTTLRAKTPLKATSTLRRTPMKRRAPVRKDGKLGRQYMGLVVQLRCAVANAHCGGRRTVHHRSGAGVGRRASDLDTICLCERHHLHGPESIEEMGSKAWERHHGVRQDDLIQHTRQAVINMILAYSNEEREHHAELLVQLTR